MKSLLFALLLFTSPSLFCWSRSSSDFGSATAHKVSDDSGLSSSGDSGSGSGVREDQHVKCKAWSLLGECELNAGYMLKSCSTSCHEYEEALSSSTPKDLYR